MMSSILTQEVNFKEEDLSNLVEISVSNCKNVSKKRKKEALKVAHILFDIERDLKVPDSMRGMILSAACKESGFNPSATGDRKFSKRNKPKAIGVLQLWPIYEKMYPGLVRTDPEMSGRAWLSHIIKMLPKVRRQCKYKKERSLWIAAWVTGIRYKKKGGRCKEKPLHLKHFIKIRKIYESQTRKSETKSDT